MTNTKELSLQEMENLQGGIYDPLGCLMADIGFEIALIQNNNSALSYYDELMFMYCHYLD